jgi:hypothetical protein
MHAAVLVQHLRLIDLSFLDLSLKLFKLQANPLGLEHFSREERVQIELLQLAATRGSELSSQSIYPSTEVGC